MDRKDKKLSQAEKRLAKRSYEMEKKANTRPMYSYYGQNPTTSTLFRLVCNYLLIFKMLFILI